MKKQASAAVSRARARQAARQLRPILLRLLGQHLAPTRVYPGGADLEDARHLQTLGLVTRSRHSSEVEGAYFLVEVTEAGRRLVEGSGS